MKKGLYNHKRGRMNWEVYDFSLQDLASTKSKFFWGLDLVSRVQWPFASQKWRNYVVNVYFTLVIL